MDDKAIPIVSGSVAATHTLTREKLNQLQDAAEKKLLKAHRSSNRLLLRLMTILKVTDKKPSSSDFAYLASRLPVLEFDPEITPLEVEDDTILFEQASANAETSEGEDDEDSVEADSRGSKRTAIVFDYESA